MSHSIPRWSWLKQRYDSNQISVKAHKIFLRFHCHTSNKNNSPSIAHFKHIKMISWFFSCFGQNKRNPYKIVYEKCIVERDILPNWSDNIKNCFVSFFSFLLEISNFPSKIWQQGVILAFYLVLLYLISTNLKKNCCLWCLHWILSV